MNNPQGHLWGNEYVVSSDKEARQEWGTPLPLVREAEYRFGRGYFHLDACAMEWNSVGRLGYFDIVADGLEQVWAYPRDNLSTSVWCNPPWNEILPWVLKAKDEVKDLGRTSCVTMLLPSRTGSVWWPIAKAFATIYEIRGRVNFRQPPGVRKASTNPEDAVFVVFRQALVAQDYR